MLNFKMSELIKSDLAKKHNISNIPNADEMDNLLDLIFYCLQPLRNLIKKPIIITSGFRCSKLNKLLNGAKNSQHLKGQAVDFVVNNLNSNEIIEIIKNSSLPYDQLINEYNRWIHISFRKNKCRYQILDIE